MERQTGAIDVEGGFLHYEAAGDGENLVFLHGFSLDTRMWDQQFQHFSQQFRTVRYDMRGFGQSSLPRESMPYSHTSDLKALLDTLGISRTVLVGLSMGGGTAVDFALTYPESVRALVLVDSTLGGYRWTDDYSNLYRAVIRRAREMGVEPARQLWLRDPQFAPAMAKPDVASCLVKMVSSYSGWHWLYRDPQVSPAPPAIGRLGEVDAPTLVIAGEMDVPDMHGVTTALKDGITGARQVMLQGAGHLSNMEAPVLFNEAVSEFLAELPEQDDQDGHR